MNKKAIAKILKNTARNVTGRGLQVASFHPVFNIPYVGTGIGGAMFDLGDSIVRRENAKNTLKNIAKGFVIGETIGAVPYVGKLAGKTKVGGAIAKNVGNVANKVAELPVVRKVGQKLDDTAEYLQNQYIDKILNRQVAYHGSPYNFEKFSNKAIGTGEGAQAHGYGHYAAINKDVAQRYADTLGDDVTNIKYKGNDYKVSFNPQIADWEIKGNTDILTPQEKDVFAYINAHNGNIQSAIEQSEKNIERLKRMKMSNNVGRKNRFLDAQKSVDHINILKNTGLTTSSDKQLYKLSVPKDDVLLREDELFNYQPKYVQDKLVDLAYELQDKGNRYKRNLLNAIGENKTGKQLYETIWDMYDNADIYGADGAAKLLSDKGIKGISYNGGIDGEARVIFNPEDIQIMKKYYNQPSLVNSLLNGINYGGLGGALAD